MKRNPDEAPDAHGLVMLQSVDELHSFLSQRRRRDTILDTKRVWWPNTHPTHPNRELTEPS